MCIFCKIISGEIPSTKLYEDDKMIIIKDINPQAPIHYLMIPKTHFSEISEMTESDARLLGECYLTLGTLKDSLGLTDGYRLIVNCGTNGCQTVPHLHVHILGGVKLTEKML